MVFSVCVCTHGLVCVFLERSSSDLTLARQLQEEEEEKRKQQEAKREAEEFKKLQVNTDMCLLQ